MPIDCVISLDNLRTVPRALFTDPITTLDAAKLHETCKALVRSAGCKPAPVRRPGGDRAHFR
jgi:mRNA-degrading endonuclease toxin of MazEF toxin-antitoxin module